MNRIRKGALAALVMIATTLPALAGEQKVKESDVPRPAIEAVHKKYPQAKLTGFSKEEEDGKTTYEVKIEDGARRIDIDLSAEGKILAEEELIGADALPKEVKKGLAGSKYAKWTLERAEKIVKEEKADDPSYELLLTDDEHVAEVVFDKGGKIVNEEEKKARKKPEPGEKGEKGEDDGD
ncbi:MAG TPA: PepSY-like domain-containing protein [Planctomycetota bacterium]|nr:PepSY-like domain-containing protein [Planctomycetota bacterium]